MGRASYSDPAKVKALNDRLHAKNIADKKTASILYPEIYKKAVFTGGDFVTKSWILAGGTPEQVRIIKGGTIQLDETPIKTREYWMQQNPNYAKALNNPLYQEERRRAKADPRQTLTGSNSCWKRKLEALDPSHPKAIVPEWVRFAKREAQGFKCRVLGWHELDYMVNKQSGEIRQVGTLTVDHTLAGANGGLTTDANTAMIASVANSKKGAKMKSYEEIREHLHSIYELYSPTVEEIAAMQSLRSKGYKKVIL